jgi:hypothetical protein
MHPHPPQYGPLKQSGPGIASCVLAGIALVLAVVLACVMAVIGLNPSSGQPTTSDWMLGFAMLGSMCGGGALGVAGLILGIIGVVVPNRSKRAATIGLIANATLLAAVFLIMAISG